MALSYIEIRKLDDKVKVCFMTAFDIQKDELKAAIPTPKEEKPTIFRNQLN
jgi:hypothetical protein